MSRVAFPTLEEIANVNDSRRWSKYQNPLLYPIWPHLPPLSGASGEIIKETFRLYPKSQSLTENWETIGGEGAKNHWKEIAQTSAHAPSTEPNTAKGIKTSTKEVNDSWILENIPGKAGTGGKIYPESGATFIKCLAVSLHASMRSAKAKDIEVRGSPLFGKELKMENANAATKEWLVASYTKAVAEEIKTQKQFEELWKTAFAAQSLTLAVLCEVYCVYLEVEVEYEVIVADNIAMVI